MRFAGQSIVVTGAASGIGRAAVELFAAEGAKVLAVDLSDSLERVDWGQGQVTTYRADAGDEAAVEAMIARSVELHGGLDILAANAGIFGGYGGIFEQDQSTWETVLRVNLVGPFLAIKYGALAMLEGGRPSAIICTASVAGLRSGAGGPAYSASKAGVVNLVKVAAQQLSGTGIRVNAVCPGLVETGMTQELFERARAKGSANLVGQLNPLHREGRPREIADAIAYLASPAASYVNGQALVVDGGLSSSLPFARPHQAGVDGASRRQHSW